MGYRDNGKMVLADAEGLDADDLKRQAYEDGVAAMTDAWKRRKDKDDDEEENKKRKKKRSDMEQELAGPLSDAIERSDAIRREAYEQSVRDLEDAWRK